ncbi:MAG TPA: FMN-binding protein [Treponema sp.]|nr:FMN-binding protein [Treponema sp.]
MKNAWSMIKLGLILAAYAVAACTVLAVVNNITSPVIKQNQERKANEAMRAVFAQADSFQIPERTVVESNGNVTIDALRLAYKDGKIVGAVAQVTGPTYDTSTIMVGIKTDGTITGVRYLVNTDTPGFGQKASDPTFHLANGKTFYEQFEGKDVHDGFFAGRTFDAISGATITSNGAAELLTAATEAIMSVFASYADNAEVQ